MTQWRNNNTPSLRAIPMMGLFQNCQPFWIVFQIVFFVAVAFCCCCWSCLLVVVGTFPVPFSIASLFFVSTVLLVAIIFLIGLVDVAVVVAVIIIIIIGLNHHQHRIHRHYHYHYHILSSSCFVPIDGASSVSELINDFDFAIAFV